MAGSTSINAYFRTENTPQGRRGPIRRGVYPGNHLSTRRHWWLRIETPLKKPLERSSYLAETGPDAANGGYVADPAFAYTIGTVVTVTLPDARTATGTILRRAVPSFPSAYWVLEGNADFA